MPPARHHTLTSIPLLAQLPQDDLARIEDRCRWRTYAGGRTIIERGQRAREVYFLVSGRVRVLNASASGRVVAFAILEAGEYFGELAAFDGEPRSATVVAEMKCRTAIMPAKDFRTLASSYPGVTLAIIGRLTKAVRAGNDRILELSSLGAAQRVCLELLRLAEPDPAGAGDWIVSPLPTQSDLALRVGTTRVTAARILGRLTAQGVVERKARVLFIRDRNALQAKTVQPRMTTGTAQRA